jgi:hypothetical protein
MTLPSVISYGTGIVAALAVDAPHDGVDAGDCRDDVSDLAALAHCCSCLEVGERRIAEMNAIRAGTAGADQVAAKLAAR